MPKYQLISISEGGGVGVGVGVAAPWVWAHTVVRTTEIQIPPHQKCDMYRIIKHKDIKN